MEVKQDAVAQYRMGQRTDVVKAYVKAPFGQRPRLTTQGQVLRGANAGAIGDPLTRELRRTIPL